MAENQEKFNAQQEKVRKIAESYEGPEKKEIAELYVDRIAKLKTAIMESQLSDSQKEDYFKRLDSYLGLVDANNMQRLRKEYEPLFKSIEATVKPEVKEQAQDDREAKLEGVADLKIRQELLGEWREANKLKQKFDFKKEQIDLLIRTKKLEVEGTELQFYMTSIEFYNDFLNTKLQEYYDTKDVGEKHEKLKDITEQGDVFFEVLTEAEKRLQEVNSQEDLVVIDLNDRNVLSEQAMFVKRKRYEDVKKKLIKQMDDMNVSKDDPIRKQVEVMLQGADEQFDTFKEAVLTAKTPEERTFQAEQANQLLDLANQHIEAAQKWLKAVDYKNAGVRSLTLVKILESEKCPTLVEKFFKTAPVFIMPQFAVGLGYYHAAHQGGESGTNTALEVADFGISLVPIVGGLWDIGFAINGTTISGRKMGTTERIVRGVIGVGSIVLDIFTFGVGGTLAKAGGKTALKAGAEVAAHVAARSALEGGTKVVAKEGAVVAEHVLAKEGAEVAEHALAKEGAEVAGHTVAGGVSKEVVQKTAEQAALNKGVQESVNNSVKALGKAEKELLVKVGTGAANAAERKAAREILKKILTESMEPFAKELGKKQAAKFAEQAAKVATRPATRVNRVLGALSFGAYKYGGAKGLEEAAAKGLLEKKAIEEALIAGKKVVGPYYLQAKFVKSGEVMWGAMAKSVGKDAAKAWWHMHNPVEILRSLQSGGKFIKGQWRRFVKGVPGNIAMNKAALTEFEQSAKTTLLTDGHDAKAVDALFADVKEKPWQQVLKENENNPLLKDPEMQEFFKSFSEQFPKSGKWEIKFTKGFPFVSIGKGEQGKALSGLYDGFKGLENDTIATAKMTYDSRRMEWKDFAEKYKDNLKSATPEQLKSFEEQFKNLHSLDRELPVNLAKIKEGNKAAKEGVKLGKEEIKKLRGELDALQEERSQLEDFLKKYSEGVASNEGKVLTQQQQVDMLFQSYEKLPEGPLKKAVDETREKLLKLGTKEIKEGSEEYKQATAQAMRTAVPTRLASIEERLALKIDEIGAAQISLKENQDILKQGPNAPKKLQQKVAPEEFAQKSAQEAKDAMAVEAKRQAIKKFEQDIKFLNSERGKFMNIDKQFQKAVEAKEMALAKKLSPQEELEVWHDIYTKLPSGPEKKAIDKMRMKNASSMGKQGSAQWKQEMGRITQEHITKRRGEVLTSFEDAKTGLNKIDPNNALLKDQGVAPGTIPSQVDAAPGVEPLDKAA